MSLAIRGVVFTIAVPGLGAVAIPWLIVAAGGSQPVSTGAPGLVLVAIGAALYLWCLWLFATVGRGTPGPWDPPREFVAVGPYRWVRNPIYVGALLVVVGEAWLFGSVALVAYAVVMAVGFHAFVTGYEEPNLRRRFGRPYETYLASVPRWFPRPPRRA